jgi:hypothetical protein
MQHSKSYTSPHKNTHTHTHQDGCESSVDEAAPPVANRDAQEELEDCLIHGPQSSGTVGPASFSGPEEEPSLKTLLKEHEAPGLGLGEATDLPASPRSPLLFPCDEATELPASPRTPPPSSSLAVTFTALKGPNG